MFEIADGSKEQLIVDLRDLSGAVTELSDKLPKFTVKRADGTVVQNLATATASGMRMFCLIDTAVSGYDANTYYKLFVGFTVGSEVPLVYAGDFQVI